MAHLSLNGYLTKKQAEKRFGRHRRTISSDITGALAREDGELLKLCRVRTKDGNVREGTELTPDSLKEMVDQGDNPTWYCLPEFIELVKRRNSGPRLGVDEDVPNEDFPPGPQPNAPGPQSEGAAELADSRLPPLPKDATERAAILQNLYLNSLRDLYDERLRNDKIFALIETIPKQQEQTNILLKNFQELLERNPSLALLSAGNTAEGKPTANPQPKRPPAAVIDVEGEATRDPTSNSKTAKASSTKPTRARRATPTKPKRKTSKRRKPSFSEKHLPSLHSLFQRSRS